jgi:hypothetical protein
MRLSPYFLVTSVEITGFVEVLGPFSFGVKFVYYGKHQCLVFASFHPLSVFVFKVFFIYLFVSGEQKGAEMATYPWVLIHVSAVIQRGRA